MLATRSGLMAPTVAPCGCRCHTFAPRAFRPTRRRLAPARAASDFDPMTSLPVGGLVRRTPSLFDVMKFNGAAPELVNGRLAMVGLLLAARNEVLTGDTALQQLLHAPVWQVAVALLWVWASLVPITKGARHEAFGIFTPRAEIANGRAAMLGWAILLALEYKAGVPFF